MGVGVTVGFFVSCRTWTPAERKRLVVVAVLFVAATVFWMAYEQAGSTLRPLRRRNTLNGGRFPASWYQSLPPLFVITFAAVFGAVWLRLGRLEPVEHRDPRPRSSSSAAAFAVVIGAAAVASTGVRVSPLWLVASALLQV